jgi:hypothetical protein
MVQFSLAQVRQPSKTSLTVAVDEYEMMRIETYSRQPDLMFHANDFRVADRFQLGLAILRAAFSQRGDCQSA